jgi:DHA1 family bicyclomycin/chloramphenicol resistance-like MFS transporter
MGFKQFVALIASLMALNALAIDSMLPALPQIGASLNIATDNERQWIITAYVLGLGSAQFAYGILADRFGRKPLLLFGVAAYACFSVFAAFANSLETMIIARALQGAGAAAAQVLCVSIVRDCYKGAQMARVMSLTFIVFLTAPIIAPSIGQAIIAIAAWNWIFIALAVFSACLLVWAALRLPETMHAEDRRTLAPARIWAALKTVLTTRTSIGYMLAMACLFGGLFGFINSVQQVFFDLFHAEKIFPLIFALVAIFMALSSLLNSRIVERLGVRAVSHRALLGFLFFAVLHFVVAFTGHETLVTFTALQAGMLFCFGLVVSNFGSIAMEPLGQVAGTGSAVQGFIGMVGGAAIGFGIGQAFDGTAVPLTLGYSICGFAALVIVLFTERGRLFQGNAYEPAAALVAER